MSGHDRLTDEGKQFFAQIKELEKLQVRIGFQAGEAAEKDGTDIANIAMWNEVGTSRAPSRPFLRKSVDENTDKITALCQSQVKRLARGATAQEILQQIGVVMEGLVQDKIRDGEFKPNAPSTIRKKKSDHPLIASSRMRQSVSFVIKPKGEGEE